MTNMMRILFLRSFTFDSVLDPMMVALLSLLVTVVLGLFARLSRVMKVSNVCPKMGHVQLHKNTDIQLILGVLVLLLI